ncbi:hypothetical protein JZ751_023574 [Albula glossodonta]|uniref:Uncharacterized protein n=1 Tax=Albula glossodonta TaxID=121402 RepID=A0A8T2NSW0_9TELE|nr:hypothetical protein JZ751_023574 [Albula glossodonta]
MESTSWRTLAACKQRRDPGRRENSLTSVLASLLPSPVDLCGATDAVTWVAAETCLGSICKDRFKEFSLTGGGCGVDGGADWAAGRGVCVCVGAGWGAVFGVGAAELVVIVTVKSRGSLLVNSCWRLLVFSRAMVIHVGSAAEGSASLGVADGGLGAGPL